MRHAQWDHLLEGPTCTHQITAPTTQMCVQVFIKSLNSIHQVFAEQIIEGIYVQEDK